MPIFDFHQSCAVPDEALSRIQNLLLSGDLFRYTSGLDSPAARLEARFAALMGTSFALAVNSCSSAIFLSLKALELEPRSRVLVPAFTFSAVPSAIIHADCQPILVNVDENYRVNLNDFEHKLNDDVKAVVISHMRGHISDLDKICALCQSRNIPVIEDAAHALGARWNDKPAGTVGDIGCYSFQSYKMINAGEGGLLVSNDPDLIAKAVLMSGAYESNWKKHPDISENCEKWQNKFPLYNVRMNNLSAVVVDSQLEKIEERAEKGLKNHDHLAKILTRSPWIDVPAPLPNEQRAPDSIQFNLHDVETDQLVQNFVDHVKNYGLDVQVFGLSRENARAFWNWHFIPRQNDLFPTMQILKRACDIRIPFWLEKDQLDEIGQVICQSAEIVFGTQAGKAQYANTLRYA